MDILSKKEQVDVATLATMEQVTLRLELVRILKECAAQNVKVDPKDLPMHYLWSLLPMRGSRQRPVL